MPGLRPPRLLLFDGLPLSPAVAAAAMAQLPPERRVKASGYLRDIDRQQCALAALLLRHALHPLPGVACGLPEVVEGAMGKPRFRDGALPHFNLSHCARAVACVVAPFEVGVDAESVAPYSPELAEAVCSPAELSWVGGDPWRFTQLWTRKESLLKWRGTGLCDDLPALLAGARGARFLTLTFPEGYCVSVCAADASVTALQPEVYSRCDCGGCKFSFL